MRKIRWIIYRIRWWRWLFSSRFPIELYTGPGHVDKASRKIVWTRINAEWEAREPKWTEK